MARNATAALVCLGLALPAVAPSALAQEAVSTARTAERLATKPSPLAAAASAPADDYGYVAWCFGAVAGYVEQSSKAMPEVIRIERAFPTPSTEENIQKVYPQQLEAARESLKRYRAALTAAEKASPRAINTQGAQALARGAAVWTGARGVTPAQLAQFWMGWTPPADCDTRAKTLEAKSNLFGQALSFNTSVAAGAVAPPEPPAAAPMAAEPPAPVVEPPAPAPAPATPLAVATAAEAPPVVAANDAPAPAETSVDDLLAAASSGQGASADEVLRRAPVLRGPRRPQ